MQGLFINELITKGLIVKLMDVAFFLAHWYLGFSGLSSETLETKTSSFLRAELVFDGGREDDGGGGDAGERDE